MDDNIQERVINIIENIVKEVYPNVKIEENVSLANLGINSLTFIKLIVNIEEEFDINVSEEYLNFAQFKTVTAIVSYIKRMMEEQNHE